MRTFVQAVVKVSLLFFPLKFKLSTVVLYVISQLELHVPVPCLCTCQFNAGGGGGRAWGWGFDIFQKFAVKFPAHGQTIPVKCTKISPPRAAHCCQISPGMQGKRVEIELYNFRFLTLLHLQMYVFLTIQSASHTLCISNYSEH